MIAAVSHAVDFIHHDIHDILIHSTTPIPILHSDSYHDADGTYKVRKCALTLKYINKFFV